jgi:S1-C subfamily serine protease
MRIVIAGVIAAILVFAGLGYYLTNPQGQVASVASSVSTQTSSIIFDTSRIVELLRTLLAAQKPPAASPPVAPLAPAVATTTVATTTSKKPSSAAVEPAKPQSLTTEQKLGLVLPSMRNALVNIVCIAKKPGGTLRGISGSGVIIDPHGIVLTVAHVGQYALIAQARPDLMTCSIRTGSPATRSYTAAPAYVSSAWIQENSEVISEKMPRGTGENDFALLAITGSDSSTPAPASFPSLPLAPGDVKIGEPIVIGSYGAEFLTSARIRTDLFPTLVYGSVRDRFTFDTTTIDLLSLGGGAAAQQGSSGGGAINQSGQLISLITTSSSGDDLAARYLHAITMPYLQRAFRNETGTSLLSYIQSGSIPEIVSAYQVKAQSQANVLIKANGLK